MVRLKSGDIRVCRVCFAIQTQVVDYFYSILPKPHRDVLDKRIENMRRLVSIIERDLKNNRRNGVFERKAIEEFAKFQTLIYQYKSICGLGITFRQKMSADDVLKNALGITDEDLEETEIEPKDDTKVLEESADEKIEKESIKELDESFKKVMDEDAEPEELKEEDEE